MRSVHILIAVAVVLTGCAGGPAEVENYPNVGPTNVMVRFTTSNGYRAVFGVNDLDDTCESHFRGSVVLQPGINKISLKPGQPTFIKVAIFKVNYRGNFTTHSGTILIPGANTRYEVDVQYQDSMSDVRFYQLTKQDRKELTIVPRSACRPK
ncbi:MAG: hypothetical protein OEZ39_19765 [Gammaproteobacteria bacterium]|nr:hypothetical protein [Gammaproteobacteria bacterium]MDH5654105.1 hypothetical protein [Gammaproteobacteria bacterium]